MSISLAEIVAKFRALPQGTLNINWLQEGDPSNFGLKQLRPGQMGPAAIDEYGMQYSRIVTGATFPTPLTEVTGAADNIAVPFVANASGAFAYAFDGVTWDRLRSSGNNSDNNVALTAGVVQTASNLFGFDVTNGDWDRLRCGNTFATTAAVTTLGNLHTMAFNYGFDGVDFARLRANGDNADGVVSVANGIQRTFAELALYNGGASGAASWDRWRSGVTNADGIATLASSVAQTVANLSIFNGATWDRVRGTAGAINVALTSPATLTIAGATADNADNVATAANLSLRTTAELYGFDGATWDRIRSGNSNAGTIAVEAAGNLHAIAFGYAFDGVDFVRTRANGDNADGVNSVANGIVRTAAELFLYNGTGSGSPSWDRARSADGSSFASGVITTGVQITTPPPDFAINNLPAANTTATITRAAGAAGVRHVCTGIFANVNNVAAGAASVVRLRDGASGAGTILFEETVSPVAIGVYSVNISRLNIVGTAATAMTLEFVAAPGAGNFQKVNMTGYSVPA